MNAQELKDLKETYISLYFKGLVVGFFGILNMYYLVSACYNAMNSQDVSFLTLFNLVAVGICLNVSINMKNQRRAIWVKIRDSIQSVAKEANKRS